VQPGRDVEHHPGGHGGQFPAHRRQHVDGVPGPDTRRIGRHHLQGAGQQGPLGVILRPHERLQPFPFGRISRVDRVEIDPLHARDRGEHVQVRQRRGTMDVGGQLDRRGRVPVRAAGDPVPVPVEPQIEPGAGADLDQVHRPGDGRGKQAQAQPQRQRALHVAGLHQPRADDPGQFRLKFDPERDQCGPGLVRGPHLGAGHRGVVAGERVIGPAQQQQVDRAEEQERRVLAGAAAGGQAEQLIGGRDGPAQRPVQG